MNWPRAGTRTNSARTSDRGPRRYGLEAARVALGHERTDVTQVYAEKNIAQVARSRPRSADTAGGPPGVDPGRGDGGVGGRGHVGYVEAAVRYDATKSFLRQHIKLF